MAGLPGDRVTVTEQETRVNGVVVGVGLALAATVGRNPSSYVREFVVAPGQVFVMGRTLDSYDSRYWGAVQAPQLIGRASRLF